MVKANELRIGNLIYELVQDFNEGGRFLDGAKEIIIVDADIIKFVSENEGCYEPIPLTPEILEKCGFEFIPEAGYFSYKLKNKPQGIDAIKVGNGIYVHQLQNLYFALTDEELEIKL